MWPDQHCVCKSYTYPWKLIPGNQPYDPSLLERSLGAGKALNKSCQITGD